MFDEVVTTAPKRSKIVRKSARKNAAAKQAKHCKNAQYRAELYQKYDGSNHWNSCGEWHSSLRALSAGTAT